MKKKEELNIRGDSQYENEVHFFTYAAHKINNMALAITDKSAKFLYTTDSNDRGMIGAKKHIYECNKLLCEHGRKEYRLGVDILCVAQKTAVLNYSPQL